MIYSYECPKCGKRQDASRSVEERDNGPLCVHKTTREGIKTRRVYNFANLQLTTQRVCDQPENKWAHLDSIDRREFRKKADREYEAGWSGSPDPDLVRSDNTRMAELYGGR